MNIFNAIILGVVQGLTEFLPVSSSGHLVLFQNFWNLQDLPGMVLFDIFLHVSTLAVVVVFFRQKVWELLTSLTRLVMRKNGKEDRENLRLIGVILLASVFTALLGLWLDSFSATISPKIVYGLFIVTGITLFISRFLKPKGGYELAGVKTGIITGIAQGIAVLPGISRSGITITAALASGISREKAGEYSFLLSIPAVLGALLLKVKDLDKLTSHVDLSVILAGMASSFILGFIALFFLLKVVRRGQLYLFGFYLIPLGVAGLFFF